MKDGIDKFFYGIGSALIGIAEYVIPRVPLPILSIFFDCLFFISCPVLLFEPTFRTIVLPNLDTAFGDTLTALHKHLIGIKTMRRLFKMIPYSIHYAHRRNRHKIVRDVRFVGIENLTKGLEDGRGVIALQAHFGNFILMTMAFTIMGFPYIVVTKEPHSAVLRDKYIKWKRIVSIRWIDADTRARATVQIIRELAGNNIVALVADERKKYDGIPAPFFGKNALTSPGPAILALRTNAPIIPTFIIDHGHNRHTVEILPPLTVAPTGDNRADISRITEEINRIIEDYIRRYPDLWAWTNQRWKQ